MREPLDSSVLEQVHGPEALTVERSVETRQEEIRALLGPLWPKLKWTTRRDVAPEEAGSSPAGHPIALRGIWDQRGFIRLARGFDSRSRDHLLASVERSASFAT